MLAKSWPDCLCALGIWIKLSYWYSIFFVLLHPTSTHPLITCQRKIKKKNISSSYFPLKQRCTREKKPNNVEGSEAEAEQLNNTSLIFLLRLLPQEKGRWAKMFQTHHVKEGEELEKIQEKQ